MPANYELTFSDPQVLVVRRALLKAEGEIPVVVGITVAGPGELVAQYLDAIPITVQSLPVSAYKEIVQEITAGEPSQPVTEKEPVRWTELSALHVMLRIVEAPRDSFALRLRVDPYIPSSCSHQYDFYASSVAASIIATNTGDPDLDLDYYYYYQWNDYGRYDSSVATAVNTEVDCRWRLRVYGAGGGACDYELDAAFLRIASSYDEVADNSSTSPIGW